MGAVMKKALVSPMQPCMSYDDPPVFLGDYVVEVADATFEVAEPLFWVDCDDTVIAYGSYWNAGQIYPVPIPPPPVAPSEVTGANGPSVM
jgi:hypothetical protein